jgi:hypothetical protein
VQASSAPNGSDAAHPGSGERPSPPPSPRCRGARANNPGDAGPLLRGSRLRTTSIDRRQVGEARGARRVLVVEESAPKGSDAADSGSGDRPSPQPSPRCRGARANNPGDAGPLLRGSRLRTTSIERRPVEEGGGEGSTVRLGSEACGGRRVLAVEEGGGEGSTVRLGSEACGGRRVLAVEEGGGEGLIVRSGSEARRGRRVRAVKGGGGVQLLVRPRPAAAGRGRGEGRSTRNLRVLR